MPRAACTARGTKVVSERLGHASISITLDTYSRLMTGMQEEAAEKIDAGLRAVGLAMTGVQSQQAPPSLSPAFAGFPRSPRNPPEC